MNPQTNTPVPVKHRSKLKIALVILAVLSIVGILAVILSLFFVQRWYTGNLKPLNPADTESKVITIEAGASAKLIGEKLEQEKIIKSGKAFDWYTNREGIRTKLQAGTYKFSPSQSVARIAEMMVNGEIDTSFITILPGKRVDEIKVAFLKSGFVEAEVDQALQADQYRATHKSLKDLPEGASLEGYIYPETLKIGTGTTPKQVIELALNELDASLTPELTEKLANKNLNYHEAFTLASIIEKETGTQADRPQIARVFLKRLNDGMELGSDVTFIYAAAITGQEATPNLDSPYNTRKVVGLPPGPISNFGLGSLQALADPAEGDFLYFVAGDDGKTYFGRTYAEHESNIAKYCTTLCN